MVWLPWRQMKEHNERIEKQEKESTKFQVVDDSDIQKVEFDARKDDIEDQGD